MFSCEFCEISKNTFFTEHLLATASNRIRVSIRFYFSLLYSHSIFFPNCFYLFIESFHQQQIFFDL